MRSQLRALRLAPCADRRLVALGASKVFCIGDVYRSLHASGCIVPHQGLNWENFVPLKVRVFFWILRLGKTRTRANLFRLGCVSSPDCPFCPRCREDVQHLFVQCPRLLAVWALIAPCLHLHPSADLVALLDGITDRLPSMQPSPRNTIVLSVLWAVWKSRNRMVFDGVLLTANQVASLAIRHLRLWVVC
jgi:hypothetical protein